MGRHTADDYRHAAEILWGEAGAWAVEEQGRINALHFGGQLPALPVVIGLTAYGRCLALTRYGGEWDESLPRITLHSGLFAHGAGAVADVILHEMVHARLILARRCPDHNAAPWCAEVERLSPAVLGVTVRAKPVHPRRVNGTSSRQPRDGHLTRKQLAGWPYSLRPPGVRGPVLKVTSH
jgi:hypothetical protein